MQNIRNVHLIHMHMYTTTALIFKIDIESHTFMYTSKTVHISRQYCRYSRYRIDTEFHLFTTETVHISFRYRTYLKFCHYWQSHKYHFTIVKYMYHHLDVLLVAIVFTLYWYRRYYLDILISYELMFKIVILILMKFYYR